MGNSLFPFETSGLLGWVVGLVGIFLLGVLLMILVDRTPAGPEDRPEANAGALELGQAQLNALGEELKRLRLLEGQQLEEEAVTRDLEKAVRQFVALSWEEEELDNEIELRLAALQDVKQAQERYALSYRDWLWKSSQGRSLEKLKTKHGETYQSVEFLNISNKGLRIRHSTGTGVIPVHLLRDSLRRELQLDLLQSQRLLRKQSEREWDVAKKAREKRAAQREERRWQRPRESSAGTTTKRIQLAALLEENRVLANRLQSLARELPIASSKAGGYGRSRSVPGSLETWGERHERLLQLQDSLQLRLNRTRSQIRAIEPGYRFWPN